MIMDIFPRNGSVNVSRFVECVQQRQNNWSNVGIDELVHSVELILRRETIRHFLVQTSNHKEETLTDSFIETHTLYQDDDVNRIFGENMKVLRKLCYEARKNGKKMLYAMCGKLCSVQLKPEEFSLLNDCMYTFEARSIGWSEDDL